MTRLLLDKARLKILRAELGALPVLVVQAARLPGEIWRSSPTSQQPSRKLEVKLTISLHRSHH
jgi:hypothetical protein